MIKMQPYEIKEIYPGHYYMLLDMLDTSDVLKVVSPDYKYLWFYDVNRCSVVWNKMNDVLPSASVNNMWIRNVNLECLIETKDINDFLQNHQGCISLVQLNEFPPTYLKMGGTSMSEKTKYDLLGKSGYLFNVFIPRPSDYGWIICSDIEYLRKISDILKG